MIKRNIKKLNKTETENIQIVTIVRLTIVLMIMIISCPLVNT